MLTVKLNPIIYARGIKKIDNGLPLDLPTVWPQISGYLIFHDVDTKS